MQRLKRPFAVGSNWTHSRQSKTISNEPKLEYAGGDFAGTRSNAEADAAQQQALAILRPVWERIIQHAHDSGNRAFSWPNKAAFAKR
jgi:hypothetical protein